MHLSRGSFLVCLLVGSALAQGLTITSPSTLLPGSPAVNYSFQFTATGGAPPYTWTWISGQLPSCCGLTLDPGGLLHGVPSQIPGNSSFQLKVTDNAGNTANQTFTMTIYPAAGSLQRTTVLSQVAAGGAWDTTIYLVNTSGNTANSARLFFHLSPSGQLWNLPLSTQQLGYNLTPAVNQLDFVMPPYSTVVLHTSASPSSPLQQGWADVLTTSSPTTGTVGAFAVFRQTYANGSSSVGTTGGPALFESSVALPFDNTSGNTTTMALVSLSTAQIYINANIFDQNGNSLGTQLLSPMTSMGQTAFALPTLLPQSANQRGVLVLSNITSPDPITGLGLQFSGSVFTSVPVVAP
jgi:hypothetical protein